MLTVIIPTKNRPSYLERSLNYYSMAGLNYLIIVADSSDKDQLDANRDTICKYKDKLNINHMEFNAETDFIHKVFLVISKVNTPYTVMVADDDILIPSSLNIATQFLDNNEDFSLVHGDVFLFKLESEDAYGQIEKILELKQCILQQKSNVQRFYNHLTNYAATFYSVHRTVHLKENFSQTDELEVGIFLQELLPSCLSLLQGKAKKMDRLYMVRQTDSGEHLMPDRFEWMLSPEWGKNFLKFEKCIADKITGSSSLLLKDAKAIIRFAFRKYLSRADFNMPGREPLHSIIENPLNIYYGRESFPLDIDVKDKVFLNMKNIMNYLKRLFNRKKRTADKIVNIYSNNSPYDSMEIPISNFLSKDSPYYHDLMLVFNLINKK